MTHTVKTRTASLLLVGLTTGAEVLLCHQTSQTKHLENSQVETEQMAPIKWPTPYAGVPGVALLRAPLSMKAKEPESLQEKKAARVYVIRVIDGASRTPVVKAKVAVELATSPKAKWEGRTDASGVFSFTWEPNTRSIRAHISIQAPGFWSIDDDNVLMDERIIQLNRED